MSMSILFKTAQRVLADTRFIYAPIVLSYVALIAAGIIWVGMALIAGSAPPLRLIGWPLAIAAVFLYGTWMLIYLWATSEILIAKIQERPKAT